MNPKERLDDMTLAVGMAARGERADIWTALPGIVQTFDPTTATCSIRPAQMVRIRDEVLGAVDVPLPLLLDCPVVFPGGGGCSLTFPLRPGDEVLVVFASRCIDSWWDTGQVLPPALFRMHDLSDGFVIPGVRSKPRVQQAIHPTETQLRTDDPAGASIGIDPATNAVTVVSAGPVTVQADQVMLGNGTLRSLVTDMFVELFNEHTHVAPTGGGVTSAPAVPMTAAQLTASTTAA